MQYHKFVLGDTIIEFHNNWLGEETVIVNGQVVSKKSSVLGINHHFNLIENGNQARYVLTTKITDLLQVAIDLRRNGELLQENVIVRYGTGSRKPVNRSKKEGLAHLQEYELHDALDALNKALDVDPKDPEIWFHLACTHSLLEHVQEGFECLKMAVENRLGDTEMILKHEQLAFLRIHPAFESFLESHFTQFDLDNPDPGTSNHVFPDPD